LGRPVLTLNLGLLHRIYRFGKLKPAAIKQKNQSPIRSLGTRSLFKDKAIQDLTTIGYGVGYLLRPMELYNKLI
jgi:hypothetical protein